MTKDEQQETAENLKMLREFGASLAMFNEEQWGQINGLLLHMDNPFDVVAFFQYVMEWAMYSKLSPKELYSHLDPGVEKRVRETLDSLEKVEFTDVNAFLSTKD